ncbi:MAG: dTDP-4-dehydrorhamnose 3,5-epimerase family protein [Arenimonas sp.]
MNAKPTALAGVERWPLHRHADPRGDLHELLRDHWPHAPRVAQWNLVQTRAGALRGLAVHLQTTDYYLVIEGRAWLGLADLRPDSPTFRRSAVLPMDGEALCAYVIPPGVAHGIHCVTDCLGLGGSSRRFDPADKFGCRWDDPALGIAWPERAPMLIERDRHWPPAAALFERVREWTEQRARLEAVEAAGACPAH